MNKIIWIFLIFFLLVSCQKNTEPSASFSVIPSTGTINDSYSFNAGISWDSETPADKLTCRWDWEGDGSWDTDFSLSKTIVHKYDEAGIYEVFLEVADNDNKMALTDIASKILYVAEFDSLPVAKFNYSPLKGNWNSNYLFNAVTSRDRETSSDDLLFRWDWNSDGKWDTEYSVNKAARHKFRNGGDISVTLEVKDARGQVATLSKAFKVSNGNGGDGTFIDARDSSKYWYKTIGTQTWMAENLAYLPSVSNYKVTSETFIHYYVYGYRGTSIDEARVTENYAKYGALYNWSAAMNKAPATSERPSGVRGSCPEGWHLPSEEEYRQLLNFVTYDKDISLEAPGEWTYPMNVPPCGFNALPGGYFSWNGFYGLGNKANFWTTTWDDLNGFGYYSFYFSDEGNYFFTNINETDPQEALSVRCVKDN
jgi:uncharacterized protein (TIGR02145 family)